jgi:hypothetical protein
MKKIMENINKNIKVYKIKQIILKMFQIKLGSQLPDDIQTQAKFFNPLCYELKNNELVPIEIPTIFTLSMCTLELFEDTNFSIKTFQLQLWQWYSYARMVDLRRQKTVFDDTFIQKMNTLINFHFIAPLQDTLHNLEFLDIFMVFNEKKQLLAFAIQEQQVYCIEWMRFTPLEMFAELKFIVVNPTILCSQDNPHKKYTNVSKLLITMVIQHYKKYLIDNDNLKNNNQLGIGLYVLPLTSRNFYKKFGFTESEKHNSIIPEALFLKLK